MIRFSDIIAFAAGAFFLLTGLGLLGFPVYLLIQNDRQPLWFWLMGLSTGLLCLSFGAGILALAVRTRRLRREQARPEAGPTDRRHCVIPASAGKHLLLFGFITWTWNLFGGFLIAIFLSRPASTFGERAMVAGWLLAGGALLLVFAYDFLTARKSGRSEFHTRHPAGHVGGVMDGQIETRAELPRATAARLSLACVAQISYNPTPVGGGSHWERTLWQAEKAIELGGLTWDGRQTVIPVNFEIPADCLPTGAFHGRRPVFWRLVVEARLPGIDYFAAFVVPVAGPAGKHSTVTGLSRE